MKKVSVILSLVVVLGSSCKKEEEIGNDNELITTVKLNFTNGNITQTYSYKDIDGDGGTLPQIDKISLKSNTEYVLSVEFLDESKIPLDNLTEEVKSESDEHLVVITPNPSTIGTYTYSDKDINGLPIGLSGKFLSKSLGNGTLKLQLRHQPPINGKNTKNGTSTPGSDDVNIDFQIEVK